MTLGHFDECLGIDEGGNRFEVFGQPNAVFENVVRVSFDFDGRSDHAVR